MKLLISLNWLFGTLLFALAILWPMLNRFNTFEAEQAVKTTVERIARQQADQLTLRGKYVYFAPNDTAMAEAFRKLNMGVPDGTFSYEAYPGLDGSPLVIRARASLDQVRRAKLPPMEYEYRLRPDGSHVALWQPLSGQERGLGLL